MEQAAIQIGRAKGNGALLPEHRTKVNRLLAAG